ncbi:MAG: ABC transporter permease [Paludibacteraceae bacterium]|nr:ABC transporter permease [Paludibacteraceae bacterium]
MNFPLFIARKIHFSSQNNERKVSKPAVRIALCGIALGLAVMIIALAVVVGFKNEVGRKVMGFGAHIQITSLTNNKTYDLPPISFSDTLINAIKEVPNVNYIQTTATKPAIIKTKTDFQGIVLKGVDEKYNWDFFKEYLREGELPIYNDSTPSNEVLISSKQADALKLNVGDKFICYFIQDQVRLRQFTISGIYSTGLADFDKLFIVSDIKHIRLLNNWDENTATSIEVFVNDLNILEDTSYNIFLATANNFTGNYNPYYTRNIYELQPQIFGWLDLLDLNMVIILILMFSVATFTMISGLLIIILEKTTLIGTLKVLGANNWTIRKIFLYQASFLIGKAMLWGNVIGLGMYFIQKYLKVVKLDPEIYFVDYAPVELIPWQAVVLNIGVGIAILCILVIPSYLIAKISPAKSIKFE